MEKDNNQNLSTIKTLEDNHYRVAIFGSSRIKEGDTIYQEVKSLAESLGEKGIDVVTGGGPGLMKAASEGHNEGDKKNGGTALTIGIGVDLPWDQKFNNSVEYKEQFNRFSKRLDEFMSLSNAVVVTPGGIGTILELFYTWQLVQVHHICHIPIILMGNEWKGLLEWVKNDPLTKGYMDEKDYELVFHAKNPEEVMRMINDSHEHWKKGGKDFCLNYKKYRLEE